MTIGRRLAALTGSLLLAASGPLAAPPCQPGVVPVRPPALASRVVTLDNGLRVILSEDHSTPIVNVQVWYHVGSKDEQPGRTGLAHLLEHLMFTGSKNVPADAHASWVSGAGGESNAYTTEDVTAYWQTVPSAHLPLVLWLEADRMAALRLDKATFERERAVVREERRMRIENQPYGRLAEIIAEAAFTVHPYRHPTIGRVADLEAATLDDVRRFYATHYVPGNATLAMVGDFEPDEALALARRYFDRIPPSPRAITRAIPTEPPAARERRVRLTEPWPLAVVVVAHHIPADGHPDADPLRLAAKVLSDGESSRIHRRLVYEQGLAVSAFGLANLLEHPGLFYAVAMVQPGRSTEEAERALVDALEQLAREPVSDRELAKVKNQHARDVIVGRESNRQKATELARAAVFHRGDVAAADRQFDRVMAVSQDDLQRVARAYFTPERRVVVTVAPGGRATETRRSR